MTEETKLNLEAELKLILHRLEEISRSQTSGFSELKTRISSIEEEARNNAVWQGKIEQRIDHIEADLDDHSTGMSAIAKMALTSLGTALTIIGTLVGTGSL